MNATLSYAAPVYLDTDLALSQIGDVQAMQGMLAMLEESLAHDIPRIAEFVEADDVPGANRLLHPLKGFIPIFCGPVLCELVSRVELLSKNGSRNVVAPAYAQLMPELNQLLSEVSAYLNENGAAQ